jgi:hypothetical protein
VSPWQKLLNIPHPSGFSTLRPSRRFATSK